MSDKRITVDKENTDIESLKNEVREFNILPVIIDPALKQSLIDRTGEFADVKFHSITAIVGGLDGNRHAELQGATEMGTVYFPLTEKEQQELDYEVDLFLRKEVGKTLEEVCRESEDVMNSLMSDVVLITDLVDRSANLKAGETRTEPYFGKCNVDVTVHKDELNPDKLSINVSKDNIFIGKTENVWVSSTDRQTNLEIYLTDIYNGDIKITPNKSLSTVSDGEMLKDVVNNLDKYMYIQPDWVEKATDVRSADDGNAIVGRLIPTLAGMKGLGHEIHDLVCVEAEIALDGNNSITVYEFDLDKLYDLCNIEKPTTYEEFCIADRMVREDIDKLTLSYLSSAIVNTTEYNITDYGKEIVKCEFDSHLSKEGISLTCDDILGVMQNEELSTYIDGKAIGHKMNVFLDTDDGRTVKIPTRMITSNEGVAVPYVYALIPSDASKSVPDEELRRLSLEAELTLLTAVAGSTRDGNEWARNALQSYKEIMELIEQSNGEPVDYTMPNGKEISITPCEDIKGSKDYTFFLTDHPVIDCAWTALEIAEKVNTLESLEIVLEQAKVDLLEYYKNEVVPVLDIPAEQRLEEHKFILQHYSDRHKDIYGVRPNGDKDMCEKALKQEKSDKDDIEH